VSVAEDKNFLNMQLKSETWAKNGIKPFVPASVKTSVLEGENFAETITKYVNRNQPDILMLLRKKQNAVESMFLDNGISKIVKQVNVPVWICFRN